MVRESTDKEGGREVVGRSGDSGRGMRHDVAKTSGRGAGFVHADHEPRKSPFHEVSKRSTTRREEDSGRTKAY